MIRNRYDPINNDFVCDRYCGDCCKKLIINLSGEDIKRIRQSGYDDEEFLTKEFVGPYKNKPILRRTKKGCVFLTKRQDGMYYCKIQNIKPEVCRKYPFTGYRLHECRPSKWDIYFKMKIRINQDGR